MATKVTVILPDIQYPDHDALVMSKIVRVIKDIQPDNILQIGDAIDFPQVSRWNVGKAGAYAPTLQKHIDGFKGLLAEIREAAPKASFTWLEGNHDLRIKDFVASYAPALGTLRALEIENLFGLSELGVKYTKGPLHVGTNTYAVHGHEQGGYSSTANAWDLKFLKRYGSDKSFVFGHTHQPFIVTRAFGYEGKVSPRFTMNVGSVMDPVKATYVKDGAVSWVPSFAVLRDNGKEVWPELITMARRQFWFEGRLY